MVSRRKKQKEEEKGVVVVEFNRGKSAKQPRPSNMLSDMGAIGAARRKSTILYNGIVDAWEAAAVQNPPRRCVYVQVLSWR